MKRSSPIRAMLALLATSQTASAQELQTSPEVVSQLARLIRWSGVMTSIVVVIFVWFALRITREFMERLSTQFPARRLFLQKTLTILQFVVYLSTGVVVTLLSIQVDATVLALIGGTLAVSIGFAIRDVVASFIAGIIIMIDRPFQVGDRVSFGESTVTSPRSVFAPFACRRSTTTRSRSPTTSSSRILHPAETMARSICRW